MPLFFYVCPKRENDAGQLSSDAGKRRRFGVLSHHEFLSCRDVDARVQPRCRCVVGPHTSAGKIIDGSQLPIRVGID